MLPNPIGATRGEVGAVCVVKAETATNGSASQIVPALLLNVYDYKTNYVIRDS